MDQSLSAAVALLTAISVGGVSTLVLSAFDRGGSFRARLERLKTLRSAAHDRGSLSPEELIARRLRDAQSAQRAGQNSIAGKLKRADMDLSPRRFLHASIALGSMVGFLALGASGNLFLAITMAAGSAYFVPMQYLDRKIEDRRAAFESEFPNAIDMMVAGLVTGRSVQDCIRTIALDGPETIRTEFKSVQDALQLSLSLPEATGRLAERVDSESVRFFSLVISVQADTGGELVKSLINLSANLRDRTQTQRLIDKHSAGPQRQSLIMAGIATSLACFLLATNQQAKETMLGTQVGILSLVACVVWMIVGAFVIRRVARIDI